MEREQQQLLCEKLCRERILCRNSRRPPRLVTSRSRESCRLDNERLDVASWTSQRACLSRQLSKPCVRRKFHRASRHIRLWPTNDSNDQNKSLYHTIQLVNRVRHLAAHNSTGRHCATRPLFAFAFRGLRLMQRLYIYLLQTLKRQSARARLHALRSVWSLTNISQYIQHSSSKLR